NSEPRTPMFSHAATAAVPRLDRTNSARKFQVPISSSIADPSSAIRSSVKNNASGRGKNVTPCPPCVNWNEKSRHSCPAATEPRSKEKRTANLRGSSCSSRKNATSTNSSTKTLRRFCVSAGCACRSSRVSMSTRRHVVQPFEFQQIAVRHVMLRRDPGRYFEHVLRLRVRRITGARIGLTWRNVMRDVHDLPRLVDPDHVERDDRVLHPERV